MKKSTHRQQYQQFVLSPAGAHPLPPTQLAVKALQPRCRPVSGAPGLQMHSPCFSALTHQYGARPAVSVIVTPARSRTCDRLAAASSAFASANPTHPMYRLYSLNRWNWHSGCGASQGRPLCTSPCSSRAHSAMSVASAVLSFCPLPLPVDITSQYC